MKLTNQEDDLSPERLSVPNNLYEDLSSATLNFIWIFNSFIIIIQLTQTFKAQCFKRFLNHSYLHPKVLHKPLISQEVAGHVCVSVVDESPQAEREQLQIHVLHRRIQTLIFVSNRITATNEKLNEEKMSQKTVKKRQWIPLFSFL